MSPLGGLALVDAFTATLRCCWKRGADTRLRASGSSPLLRELSGGATRNAVLVLGLGVAWSLQADEAAVPESVVFLAAAICMAAVLQWAGLLPFPEPEGPAKEVRVDPIDGRLRTFQELQAMCAKKYNPAEIQQYWDKECKPLGNNIRTGTLCATKDDGVIFASTSSWNRIGLLAAGQLVFVAGPPEHAEAYIMVPIRPKGAIELSHLQVVQMGDYVRMDDQLLGQVRFAGTTKFAEGDWVGVECQDAIGKNNGSLNGVTYFKCKDNHGLFIKPKRLQLATVPAAHQESTKPIQSVYQAVAQPLDTSFKALPPIDADRLCKVQPGASGAANTGGELRARQQAIEVKAALAASDNDLREARLAAARAEGELAGQRRAADAALAAVTAELRASSAQVVALQEELRREREARGNLEVDSGDVRSGQGGGVPRCQSCGGQTRPPEVDLAPTVVELQGILIQLRLQAFAAEEGMHSVRMLQAVSGMLVQMLGGDDTDKPIVIEDVTSARRAALMVRELTGVLASTLSGATEGVAQTGSESLDNDLGLDSEAAY